MAMSTLYPQEELCVSGSGVPRSVLQIHGTFPYLHGTMAGCVPMSVSMSMPKSMSMSMPMSMSMSISMSMSMATPNFVRSNMGPMWPKGLTEARYGADRDWRGPNRAKMADLGQKMSKTKSLRIGRPGGQKLS